MKEKRYHRMIKNGAAAGFPLLLAAVFWACGFGKSFCCESSRFTWKAAHREMTRMPLDTAWSFSEQVNLEEKPEPERVTCAKQSIVPEQVRQVTEKVGAEYGICPEFLQAIAWRESRFQTDAVNYNESCIGIMRISKKWNKERMRELGVTDLFDMESNIRVAADFLRELAEKYRDPAAVLMRYNGDSKAFSYQQGKSEISGYAKDVLELCKSLGGEPDIVFFYKADDTQSFTFGRNISGI